MSKYFENMEFYLIGFCCHLFHKILAHSKNVTTELNQKSLCENKKL